jgi:hypothetical protein
MTGPVQPTTSIPSVRPGDLITADFMNRVIGAFNALDGRVTKLESGTPSPGQRPQIDRVVGPGAGGLIRVGDRVRIEGRSFGVPAALTVTIEGISAAVSQGESSDSVVVITMPNLQAVPSSGREVTMTVNNPSGPSTTKFNVLPAQATIPRGQLFINLAEGPGEKIKPLTAKSYTFKFSVRGLVNPTETFDLKPTIGRTGWTATVVDAADKEIPSPTVTFPGTINPPGQVEEVRVRVAVPATATAGQTAVLKLSATAQHDKNFSQESGGDTLTVDQDAPAGQTEIAIGCAQVTFPDNEVAPVTGTVTIPAGSLESRLDFSVHVTVKGGYAIKLTAPPDPQWSWHLSGGASVMEKTLTANADNVDLPFFVFIKAPAGAAATNVAVAVTKAADTSVTQSFSQPVKVQ